MIEEVWRMKLGFVSSILADWDFKGTIDVASELGFSCVELACWPQGKAERRYGGVSHIDTEGLTKERAAEILGGGAIHARPVHLPGLDDVRAILSVTKERPTPKAYPRRAGQPEQKSLK